LLHSLPSSSIGVGQAATGRFPEIRWSAVANDRSDASRIRTLDPYLPFDPTKRKSIIAACWKKVELW
jgi:hypothetical protein